MMNLLIFLLLAISFCCCSSLNSLDKAVNSLLPLSQVSERIEGARTITEERTVQREENEEQKRMITSNSPLNATDSVQLKHVNDCDSADCSFSEDSLMHSIPSFDSSSLHSSFPPASSTSSPPLSSTFSHSLSLFRLWMIKYHKQYSVVEFTRRFHQWLMNEHFIQKYKRTQGQNALFQMEQKEDGDKNYGEIGEFVAGEEEKQEKQEERQGELTEAREERGRWKNKRRNSVKVNIKYDRQITHDHIGVELIIEENSPVNNQPVIPVPSGRSSNKNSPSSTMPVKLHEEKQNLQGRTTKTKAPHRVQSSSKAGSGHTGSSGAGTETVRFIEIDWYEKGKLPYLEVPMRSDCNIASVYCVTNALSAAGAIAMKTEPEQLSGSTLLSCSKGYRGIINGRLRVLSGCSGASYELLLAYLGGIINSQTPLKFELFGDITHELDVHVVRQLPLSTTSYIGNSIKQCNEIQVQQVARGESNSIVKLIKRIHLDFDSIVSALEDGPVLAYVTYGKAFHFYVRGLINDVRLCGSSNPLLREFAVPALIYGIGTRKVRGHWVNYYRVAYPKFPYRYEIMAGVCGIESNKWGWQIIARSDRQTDYTHNVGSGHKGKKKSKNTRGISSV
jgi:hypothetical protein